MTAETLVDLIARSYGNEEVHRHLAYRPSSEHLEMVKTAGAEILRRSPVIPGACTYLSAMWAALLRDNMHVPAFCVAGDLCVRGRMTFGSANPEVARSLTTSNLGWDGHCWLALGEYLGDISIFRTAYAAPERSNLRAVVVEQFGFGHELFLDRWFDAQQIGFDYQPKHVATEVELNGLIQGACAVGRL